MIDPFTGLPYDALIAFALAACVIVYPIGITLIVLGIRFMRNTEPLDQDGGES